VWSPTKCACNLLCAHKSLIQTLKRLQFLSDTLEIELAAACGRSVKIDPFHSLLPSFPFIISSRLQFYIISSIPLCCGRRHGFDLNLWQWRGLSTEVGCPCIGVLGVVIRNGGFDSVLCKHGAVHYKSSVQHSLISALFNLIQVCTHT
jgi:hypothetical protein